MSKKYGSKKLCEFSSTVYISADLQASVKSEPRGGVKISKKKTEKIFKICEHFLLSLSQCSLNHRNMYARRPFLFHGF